MTRSEFDRKYTSQLNPQQLAAVHAVNGAVLLLYVLVDWLLRYVLFRNAEAVYALLHILLPNALYTFILSPLVYVLIYRVARSMRES